MRQEGIVEVSQANPFTLKGWSAVQRVWRDAEGHPTGHGVAGAGGYNLELPLIVTGVRASLGSSVEELTPYPQALRVSKLAVGGGKGMQEPFLFSLNSRHVPFP